MLRRDLLAAPAALGLALPAAAQTLRRKHAISLLGEPALPAGFTHWPFVNPDAPKGGDITLTALGSFDSFNGFILRGTPAVGLGQLYDTLTVSGQDEASTEYAHLAETIELPADNLGVAFELRADARFHDGRAITAHDVVWTFDTLRAQGRPFYRAYWGDVENVRAESDRRVVFRFRTSENRELAQVLGQMPVLPRHWWESRDFARPLQEPPLGSGPYRIERFEQGRTLVYRRVADYWAANLGTRRGMNNFDSIRYEYFRDSTVAFEAFRAGQIDFRTENIARDWSTGYDFPAARRGLVQRDTLRHEIPTGMQGFAMNLRRPLFQDIRVREALVQVFDYEWLNANIFFGLYARTQSFFSNSELASSGLPTGRELAILERFRGQVPEQVFTTEFRLPVTDGSGNNRDGLRRALDLMRAAGWTVRDRRLVNAQGQPFRFEILLSSPSFERVALPYVQWLQRLGIEATVRTVDPAQYQVRMDAFDFDMTVDVMGQSLSPGNEQRDYFSCAKARENGSQNIPGICHPVLDQLVEMIITAPDREELVARTRAMDRVLLWNHFVIPNWHNRAWWIAFWDRFGRPPRAPRYGLGFPATWWIDPAKDRALQEARRSL
jgi:microcin C transport system substrate-binding protein